MYIIMVVAGELLKKQFPTRAGFQHTCSFWVLRTTGGTLDNIYIQWGTMYFESLYLGYLSDEVQQQLRALYGHLTKAPFVHVQHQQGINSWLGIIIIYCHLCCEPGLRERPSKSEVLSKEIEGILSWIFSWPIPSGEKKTCSLCSKTWQRIFEVAIWQWHKI